MTPIQVRNEIEKAYLAEYNGQFPIAIDNKRLDRPNEDTWVRLSIQFNDGKQGSFGITGNRKFLKYGFIYVQVFTPANEGTDDNDILVENSMNLFDGTRIEQLWMYNGKVKTVGSDGQFYQQNAVIEFSFENIR